MAHAARRTQAERRASSESALLRSAAELIAERGLDGASLRSVGERAGVSRGMPAYHFGSKDGLIERLVERGHEQTLDAALEALAASGRDPAGLSKLDALQSMIGAFLGALMRADAPEERAVVVLWGATFPSESRLEAMVESDAATHRVLADHIRAGQVEGSMRSDLDADAAAVMVMGIARGVAALTLTHGRIADADRVRDLCGDAIVGVLAAPAGAPRARPRGGRGA